MSKTFAYIPSAYNVGKTYTAIPNDGNGDFDFSRGNIATRINENGLIEEMATNVPRIDYANGGCPELLLEGESENLITYSEDFTEWTRISSSGLSTPTVTPNFGISPSGENNATRLQCDSGSGNSYIVLNYNQPLENCVGSLWMKSLSSDVNVVMDLNNNLSTTHMVTSEWTRFYVERSTVTANIRNTYIGKTTSGGDDNIDILIYGAQVEVSTNGKPTSYIPTNGAEETRAAEKCGGSVINIDANSCVWGLELQAREAGTTVRRVQMSDDADNYIAFGYGVSSQSIFFTLYDGTTTSSIVFNNSDNTKLRTLTGLKNGNEQVFKIDGVMVGYLKTAPTLNNMTTMYYSSNGTSFFMDGKTRNNTIDDDVSSFDSTATSYTELDAQINNFTTR